mmetsp:Transcript_2940/g.10288  ORF Transcript_2940/g.10288 Transcript_2940/m.10288 type:complete len:236 (-) Transcript_2940:956-1663(-)
MGLCLLCFEEGSSTWPPFSDSSSSSGAAKKAARNAPPASGPKSSLPAKCSETKTEFSHLIIRAAARALLGPSPHPERFRDSTRDVRFTEAWRRAVQMDSPPSSPISAFKRRHTCCRLVFFFNANASANAPPLATRLSPKSRTRKMLLPSNSLATARTPRHPMWLCERSSFVTETFSPRPLATIRTFLQSRKLFGNARVNSESALPKQFDNDSQSFCDMPNLDRWYPSAPNPFGAP